MPDVMILATGVLQLFWSQGCFTIQYAKVGKGIIQPNIYSILPKVNQVANTLDTIYMPNIMILAQEILQIFWSQGHLRVKCLSRKRRIIRSNIHRILRNIYQIIYIMYTNCMPKNMILA